MKAARLYEYDPAMNVQLKIENVKAPTIMGPTDVIVKVGAAGLCRTDLHIIEGVWKDIMDQGGNLLPYIMGHENAGWVEDVGSGVTSVKPGDTVICHPHRTCGICLSCRYGDDMHCEHSLFPGLGLDGGFALGQRARGLASAGTGLAGTAGRFCDGLALALGAALPGFGAVAPGVGLAAPAPGHGPF